MQKTQLVSMVKLSSQKSEFQPKMRQCPSDSVIRSAFFFSLLREAGGSMVSEWCCPSPPH